jgi:hypothetical protein
MELRSLFTRACPRKFRMEGSISAVSADIQTPDTSSREGMAWEMAASWFISHELKEMSKAIISKL